MDMLPADLLLWLLDSAPTGFLVHDLVDALGVSSRTGRRYIEKLDVHGLIEPIGESELDARLNVWRSTIRYR